MDRKVFIEVGKSLVDASEIVAVIHEKSGPGFRLRNGTTVEAIEKQGAGKSYSEDHLKLAWMSARENLQNSKEPDVVLVIEPHTRQTGKIVRSASMKEYVDSLYH